MVFAARSTDGVTAEMNVLPLIDILLVLVIVFFVLNLGFQFIPVQIPARESVVPALESHQLVLELTRDGGYALNAQPVPADQLPTQLTAAFEGHRARILFVRASSNRSLGEVVAAMDVARGAGAEVLAWMP